MSSVIDRLRNDEDYYGEFGSKYLSNSDVESLVRDPMSFKKPRPDTPNFATGRYFHQSILEPDKANEWGFCDASTRNTNIYKDFIAERGVEVALLLKEAVDVQAIVKEMMGNITFYENIKHKDAQYEVPAIKEMMGFEWKGKADIVLPDVVIDLKTTSDIFAFRWNAKKYNYDSQAWIYGQLFGRPLVFYVIDKKTKRLGIFEPSSEFLEGGKAKVGLAVENYKKFFSKEKTEDIDSFYIYETI
jgi:hypothetical protein